MLDPFFEYRINRKKQFFQFNDEVVTPISTLQTHKPTPDEKLLRYVTYLLPQVSSNVAPIFSSRRTYARKKRRIEDSDIEADRYLLFS